VTEPVELALVGVAVVIDTVPGGTGTLGVGVDRVGAVGMATTVTNTLLLLTAPTLSTTVREICARPMFWVVGWKVNDDAVPVSIVLPFCVTAQKYAAAVAPSVARSFPVNGTVAPG
jgi:hypothetical protein